MLEDFRVRCIPVLEDIFPKLVERSALDEEQRLDLCMLLYYARNPHVHLFLDPLGSFIDC